MQMLSLENRFPERFLTLLYDKTYFMTAQLFSLSLLLFVYTARLIKMKSSCFLIAQQLFEYVMLLCKSNECRTVRFGGQKYIYILLLLSLHF